MEEYSDLILELSHPIRIQILLLLQEDNLSFSKIMNNFKDSSKSEISRHLSRLMDHQFIEKELPSGRNYKITSFGKVVISIFTPINFVFKHSDYFKNRNLDILPVKLIHNLDYLANSDFLEGLGNVMVKIQDFLSISVEEMWMMTDSRFPFKWDAKIMNFLIPPEMIELKDMALKHHKNTKFRVRLLKSITIALVINSLEQGLLFFPKIGENKPDFSTVIIINDKKGIKFLKQIWNFFWERAEINNDI